MRTSVRFLLGAVLVVAACSSETPASNGDAAKQDLAEPTDAPTDVAIVDVTTDASAPDASVDVASDQGPDAIAEATVDAGGADDAAVDGGGDATEDVTTDVGPEVGSDAGDATSDDVTLEDAAVDAGAEVGADVVADLGDDVTTTDVAEADAPAMDVDATTMDSTTIDATAMDATDAGVSRDAADASLDADASGVDPSFAGVVLLLHMEGPVGGRTFVDVGGHTVRADGAARIGTTARFGSGGASFDGSGSQLVVAPRARELVFDGPEAFTLEAWVNGTGTIFSCDSFGLVMSIKDARTLYVWVNGVLPWDFTGTPAGTVPEGWHHVALTYDGATYRWFIDGAMTLERAGRLSSQTNDYLVLGGYSGGVQPWFNGTLDEVRVTRGVARYTVPFSPPTAPFPDR